MSSGHAVAQRLFLEIGARRGYMTQQSYSSDAPTDGIWLTKGGFASVDRIPVAAIEVVASESLKTWRGSIATLEEVSPSIGILLLQDEEIFRRLVRKGMEADEAKRSLERTKIMMQQAAARSRQRIIVMTMPELRCQHVLTGGTTR